MHPLDLNARGIRDAERQLIAMDQQLHRITHRCEFDKRHLHARYETHVEKMLSELTFSPDSRHECRLAGLQFLKCQDLPPL